MSAGSFARALAPLALVAALFGCDEAPLPPEMAALYEKAETQGSVRVIARVAQAGSTRPMSNMRAEALGMAYVSGVEISVSFAGETVHILGFGFDPEHPDLVEGLARLRAGRITRAQEMGESLARAGIEGAYEGALALAPKPELVSRTHFARFLVEHGHCSSVHEVFSRFLKEGKPGFVPHRWAGLGEALRWVHGAGGITAIAHPARYKLTPNEEHALFTEFKAYGGAAVEVVTGSHTAAEYVEYAQMAREFGLAASRGSDFHSPDESHTDLGQLPHLPGELTPVWELLADRIQ